MTTIRVPKRERWVSIARETINDSRLSFRARGILTWLLDKPDDWETTGERLEQQGTEGREAIRSALKELEKLGYLRRQRYKDDDNKWRSEWTVYEKSCSSPPTGSRSRVAVDGFPSHIEKTETNTQKGFSYPQDGLARFPSEVHQCDNCVSGWVEGEDGNAERCVSAALARR